MFKYTSLSQSHIRNFGNKRKLFFYVPTVRLLENLWYKSRDSQLGQKPLIYKRHKIIQSLKHGINIDLGIRVSKLKYWKKSGEMFWNIAEH